MTGERIIYPYTLDENPLGSAQQEPVFKGERVLGVGFTRRTGLGYVMGTGFTNLGAELIVGGSSEGSVGLALKDYQRRAGVDPSLLSPFIADLRDSTQIDKAVNSLQKPPTLVVYASATGMEGFFLRMSGYLAGMREIKDTGGPDADDKIAGKKMELRENLAVWVPQYYADALAVNCTAPAYLIGRLVDRFGSPFRFAYINSTFGFLGKGPIHYENVYRSKHLMSLGMSENADRLASLGVDMHEEVDPVIEDTDIGTTIMEDIRPFWPERVQWVIEKTAVSRDWVFGSVRLFAQMSTEQRLGRPKPNRHFLIGNDGAPQVLEHFPSYLDIDAKEFDF